MAPKRQRSPSPAKSSHEIWTSNKIEDRDSVFIAYFSPTMPPKELQSNPEYKSASHRMLAWRTPGSQRTLVAKSRALETGSDDDGEKYGGRRALKVLEEMRVEGALVVVRWYGGIMLGPVRFNHIEDCARDAIRAFRQNEENETQKRRKIETEAKETVDLVVDLKARDQSIKVLRGLLDEKTSALKNETASQRPPTTATALPREIDYSIMPLERLRQMAKARDGTIAFLLKRIDEVEKQLEAAPRPKAMNLQKDDIPEPSKEDSKLPNIPKANTDKQKLEEAEVSESTHDAEIPASHAEGSSTAVETSQPPKSLG